MKLKIESGGLPANTKVTDVETGESIEGITNISLTLGAGQLSTAEICLEFLPFVIQGEAVWGPDVPFELIEEAAKKQGYKLEKI